MSSLLQSFNYVSINHIEKSLFKKYLFSKIRITFSLSRETTRYPSSFHFQLEKAKRAWRRSEIRRRAYRGDIAQSKGYVSERAIYPRTKTSRATLQLRREDSRYMTHRIRVIQMEGFNANVSRVEIR